MKKIFDLIIVVLSIPIFLFLLIAISIIIKIETRGPIIFWSDRVGKNNRLFSMPKFRTMILDTPLIETNKLNDQSIYITKFGKLLRSTSLDELPQLWSILKGDMSVVGPRPALYNQYDLIKVRTQSNVHLLIPGITGWAQVNGRDFVSINEKSELDKYYMQNKSITFDLYIIILTFVKLFYKSDIKH